MDLSLLLLIAAVVLFVVSVIPPIGKAWMVPIGLACFAGSFLFEGIVQAGIGK
jgi:uncharacterized membrane protein YgdD (TMEM256/DUF423 family)